NATDPEKTFFEEFPQALGYSITDLNQGNDKVETYFMRLREAIKEIQTSPHALLERYENYVLSELSLKGDFLNWRTFVQARLKTINVNLIPPYLKTFLMRLNSKID